MPFVANDQSDEEEKKQAGQQGPVSPVGGAIHLAPSSGVGSAAPAGSTSAPQKDAGGSFATLDKYLTANQGQAAPLAGKITDTIGNEYKGLDQGNQGVLQNIQGQVQNAPGYTKGDSDLLAQEQASPVSFAGDQNNVSAFQKQLMDSYGGPLSAEGQSNFQTQQAKVNDAISQGQANTNTEAGRQNLIGQNSARPTTGVKALNSAILSQDPDYLGKVESAYKPFQNLVTGLQSGAGDINKTIAAEQADAANASKTSREGISNQITGLNTSITNNLSTAQQNATAQNAAVNKALKEGTADPSVLSTLGMSQDQWNTLTSAQKAAATSEAYTSANGQYSANSGATNIDLGGFNKQLDPNAVFNTANVATNDDYQKAQAFQSLLNGLNLNTPQSIIDQSTASQAGTAPTSTNTYNYDSALNTAQTTKQAETAAAQAYVAALQDGADEQHAQANADEAAKQVQLAQNIGTGVGTVAGGVVGTIFPILGGPVGGAAIGGALGTAAGNTSGHVIQNYAQDVQGPSSTGRTADIATGGLATPVRATVQTVTSIFCFHAHTPITMKSSGEKMIMDIRLGDQTLGGEVLAIKHAMARNMYSYDGVFVTGKHAVNEGGKWIRVEDTISAIPVAGTFEVYNLVTVDHRIWVNGIMFADEYETDEYEMLDLDQSIKALNFELVR